MLLSGRRSGEQRAKDGRYQATVGLRSVDKRSSAGQSGDCFRPVLDRSSVSVGRRLGAPDPYEVDRLSVDCCPTLCRSQIQKKKKKKKKKKIGKRQEKTIQLGTFDKKVQSTRKQPKSDTTSADGSIDSRLICPIFASQTSAACWFGKCECVTRTKTFD